MMAYISRLISGVVGMTTIIATAACSGSPTDITLTSDSLASDRQQPGSLEFACDTIDLRLYSEVASSSQDNPLLARAVDWIDLEDFNEAQQVAREAINLDPKSVEARYLLGYTHYAVGDLTSALELSLEIYEKIDPQFEPAVELINATCARALHNIESPETAIGSNAVFHGSRTITTLESVGTIKREVLIPALVSGLHGEYGPARTTAFTLLQDVDEEVLKKELDRMVHDTSPSIKVRAVVLLERVDNWHEKDWVLFLYRSIMESSSAEAKLRALGALGWHKDNPDIENIIASALDDADAEVRLRGTILLGK